MENIIAIRVKGTGTYEDEIRDEFNVDYEELLSGVHYVPLNI
jgi:hypothetical protein